MRTKKEVIVLATLFALLFLSSIVLAVNCPIPDTGQTKCYDNTQEITCPQPGEPFYGQDAQYICNPQSYTKLDAIGNDLPDTATEWVMVRDNVTGLIWENKTDDGSIHDKDNTYNWNDAQSDFIATLNSQYFGWFSDWRLPTIMELAFLVDRGKSYQSINTTYYPNTQSFPYWSSTTFCCNYSDYAWVVGFDDGYVLGGTKSTEGVCVRAVRGGQCGSFGNYVDNGNGTVTDSSTSLMWQQDTAPDTYTWQQALSYCENLTLASHNDWRLPNVNELHSIVDYNTHNPSINTTFFPNTQPSYFWTSTAHVSTPSYACYVGFDGGRVDYDYKSDYYYVRAVRGGQCGSFDTSTTTTVTSTTTTVGPITTTTSLVVTTTTIFSGQWAPMPSWTTNQLAGIWGSSAADVFAVGYNGTILHYGGLGWASMTNVPANWFNNWLNLYGIWGTSATDVFAVGDYGTIHYDGNTWESMTNNECPYSSYFDIWGTSDTDIYVLGDSFNKGLNYYDYYIVHYDGQKWTEIRAHITGSLSDIWGTSSKDVFAVGSTILHYDGSVWSKMDYEPKIGLLVSRQPCNVA